MTPKQYEEFKEKFQILCQQYNIEEYVLISWHTNNSISIDHSAKVQPTEPMLTIKWFSEIVARRVQQESKIRKQQERN